MNWETESLLKGRQFKQILENQLHSLRDQYGLKRAEIEVLYFLSCSGNSNTATGIAENLCVNKGNVSQITSSLIQKGLITAEKDDRDYRVVHYHMTDAAAPVIEEIRTAISNLYANLFRDISDRDQATLKRIAEQLADNISHMLSMGGVKKPAL